MEFLPESHRGGQRPHRAGVVPGSVNRAGQAIVGEVDDKPAVLAPLRTGKLKHPQAPALPAPLAAEPVARPPHRPGDQLRPNVRPTPRREAQDPGHADHGLDGVRPLRPRARPQSRPGRAGPRRAPAALPTRATAWHTLNKSPSSARATRTGTRPRSVRNCSGRSFDCSTAGRDEDQGQNSADGVVAVVPGGPLGHFRQSYLARGGRLAGGLHRLGRRHCRHLVVRPRSQGEPRVTPSQAWRKSLR